MPSPFVEIDVDDFTVKVTNPDKVYFSACGATKLDLVNYYVAVGAGALRAVRERPTYLKRHPEGAESDPIYQKRIPEHRPPWIETARVSFPSGRHADALCPTHVADLAWCANLGTLDFHPWPARRADVDHPDELRIDLDPQPGRVFADVRRVAAGVHELLDEIGYVGFPKTSGSRGLHIYVRIEPRWGFIEMRRAALALAREVERRMPDDVTSAWWKEQRGEKVFIDFNQNARDRTIASAYSVRANPQAKVSTPLRWDEVADAEPPDLTLRTVPARFAELGDVHAAIDDVHHSLEPLLELAARDEAGGLGDAPWPPNFPKMPGEPKRVQPSKARPEPEA
ncbi:MAG: non-homologous end-joining DNA ligase [Mycobacteriales bacterium]|nr:non-homologous end-joining DNA ligase [Frankia sp.]